ncbi:MAG: hypothetical protein J5I98_23550 [Phaeodactylibacter sp.]|nr:hypothetical protein [Phaeodactylibacter sp.]
MPIPPKARASAASETEKSWVNHAQTDIQKEPERLEEAAKFLVGVISISLTIFISNRPEAIADWTSGWFIAATVIWMLSVVLSFFVLFPWRYKFNEDSPKDIKNAYRRISATKMLLLVLSLGCFFLALVLASYAFLAGLKS